MHKNLGYGLIKTDGIKSISWQERKLTGCFMCTPKFAEIFQNILVVVVVLVVKHFFGIVQYNNCFTLTGEKN